jgi:hypothetical protein
MSSHHVLTGSQPCSSSFPICSLNNVVCKYSLVKYFLLSPSLIQSRSSSFLPRLFIAERNSTNGGVEMECLQASCMHLFPYPGNRSCRNSNNAAARELVIARSVEGETAGDFPTSCSYGNIHTHICPCFFSSSSSSSQKP